MIECFANCKITPVFFICVIFPLPKFGQEKKITCRFIWTKPANAMHFATINQGECCSVEITNTILHEDNYLENWPTSTNTSVIMIVSTTITKTNNKQTIETQMWQMEKQSKWLYTFNSTHEGFHVAFSSGIFWIIHPNIIQTNIIDYNLKVWQKKLVARVFVRTWSG